MIAKFDAWAIDVFEPEGSNARVAAARRLGRLFTAVG